MVARLNQQDPEMDVAGRLWLRLLLTPPAFGTDDEGKIWVCFGPSETNG